MNFYLIDIDECVTEMDNCHMNATCNNTFGSFECTCDAGFEGNGVNCTSKKSLQILAKVGDVPYLHWLTVDQYFII